jgi:cell division FtsZ-interacting protein ZapD
MARRVVSAVCGLVLVAGVGGVVAAQGQRDDPADTRAFQLLLFEVRELRRMMDDLSRRQVQAQALGTVAVVQQGRVSQVTARLDAARAEHAAASERAQSIAGLLERFTAERQRATAPGVRQQLDGEIERLTLEQAAVFDRQLGAERRVADLTSQLAAEEARWTSAIERLEAVGR